LTTRFDEPDGRPYFLWDEDVCVGRLREILAGPSCAEQDRLLGKMLREARDIDVWAFVSPATVAEALPRLQRRSVDATSSGVGSSTVGDAMDSFSKLTPQAVISSLSCGTRMSGGVGPRRARPGPARSCWRGKQASLVQRHHAGRAPRPDDEVVSRAMACDGPRAP
jgi:hypothetical protein